MKNPNELYIDARNLWEKKQRLELEAAKIKEQYYKAIEEYRIISVNNVLDFIRINKTKIDCRNFDTLLCHCQNKLNGNIDGVELSLDDHFFVKEGEIIGNDE